MKSQILQSFQCQAFCGRALHSSSHPGAFAGTCTCPDPAAAVATTVSSPSVSSLESGLWDKSNRSTSTPRGEICFLINFWYGKKIFNYSWEAQLWFSLEGLGRSVIRHLWFLKCLDSEYCSHFKLTIKLTILNRSCPMIFKGFHPRIYSHILILIDTQLK